MQLIDVRFRQHPGRYLAQCALGTVAILTIFSFLNALIGLAVVASLGATTFIVFAMPHGRTARPRATLGGYFAGALFGSLFANLAPWLANNLSFVGPDELKVICGALAVGCTFFAMVATNSEHPPAAGLALGYVVGRWSPISVCFALSAVAMLTLVRWLLRRKLIDLA